MAKKSVKKRSEKKTTKPTETPEQRAEMLKFLKLAMQTERQGLKFYLDVKRNIKDYNMTKLMEVIMEQEKEHLRIVTELFNAEKKKGIEEAAKVAETYKKQKPLQTPIESMKHLDQAVKKKSTIYELFNQALSFEQDISQLYTDMAKKAKNAKVKAVLKKLADEELRHRDFIRMHQDSVYNTGHWFGWDHVRLEM